ncbi:hypothetical protein J7L87_02780, partial [bacterium]|nr:hypothetical protein [bacterium]
FGLNEDDVQFLGYWVLQPDKDPRKKDIKISAWVRKKEKTALIVIGNLTKKDFSGEITLPLKLLGLPRNTVICDGEENHKKIPHKNGKIKISVKSYNYRILLAGPAGYFPVDLPHPGSLLPKPQKLIKKLCDDFNSPSLSDKWSLVCSKASSGRIRIYRNRLQVLASDYKFAAAQMVFGIKNASVQVRVETLSKAHQNKIGLLLLWDNGNYVFAGPVLHRGKFFYMVKYDGKTKSKWGSNVNLSNPPGMHQTNWVRIKLTENKIIFYGSSDGKKWNTDWIIDRVPSLSSAPSFLRLGKSPFGKDELPYKPKPTPAYFDDLIVGLPD